LIVLWFLPRVELEGRYGEAGHHLTREKEGKNEIQMYTSSSGSSRNFLGEGEQIKPPSLSESLKSGLNVCGFRGSVRTPALDKGQR
jgi:hypothetical protein